MQVLSAIRLKSTLWNELLVVFGGVLLLFAASQIEIPLEPVPITLQTVAVMLIGLTYSSRHALESILLWYGLIAIGFPLLAGFKGGIGYFAGPTGGYLVGFALSAYLMAFFRERFSLNSWISDALLCLIGTLLLYTLGVAWLAALIGFSDAIAYGVMPFILPGVIKGALLCTVLQLVRQYRGQ
ncbi:MAG: biotin transporter BioY [Alphaproteobacteria bacterium]|nr:biotin transporter BioY [Alphaproteobacteria bacterium]